MQLKSDTSLMLEIQLPEHSKLVSANDITVNIKFTNKSGTDVRLLKVFEPVPIFFSIQLTDSARKTVDVPGAGKISIPENLLEYVSVPAGASYIKSLRISDFLQEYNKVLPYGKYRCKIIYHNQYGNNCVKGWFESNVISFEVKR